jgi:hypothetical protein
MLKEAIVIVLVITTAGCTRPTILKPPPASPEKFPEAQISFVIPRSKEDVVKSAKSCFAKYAWPVTHESETSSVDVITTSFIEDSGEGLREHRTAYRIRVSADPQGRKGYAGVGVSWLSESRSKKERFWHKTTDDSSYIPVRLEEVKKDLVNAEQRCK